METQRRTDILVVDDETASASYMALALGEEYEGVRIASNGIEALLAIESSVPDLIVSDLRMPEMDGLELLERVKQRWPHLPFVLVTVEEEVATIVEAVRAGAANYMVKPASPQGLIAVARRALRSSRSPTPATDGATPEIVGVSRAMVQVRHLIALASRNDVNVLVTGKTGTGKELVARAVHRLSVLADHFLGADADRLSPDALDALSDCPWPGNVRQLRNVLRAAMTTAGEGPIEPHHLALDEAAINGGSATASGQRALTLKQIERRAILDALEQCHGNITRAARRLGINRSTLRRKLQADAPPK